MTTRAAARFFFRWGALVLLAVLLLIIGTATWIVATPSGTRFAAERVQGVLGDALSIGRVEGTLRGPLTITGLHYRDPAGSLDVRADRVSLDIELLALLRLTAHVSNCDVRGVSIVLGPPQPTPKEEPSKPFSLEPPIDMRLDRFTLAKLAVHRDRRVLVEIDSAAAAGAWTHEGLQLRQLRVRSPQGDIRFDGAVSGEKIYAGEGHGRFRWQAGERLYAGTLDAQARDALGTLNIRLSQPLDAHLVLHVEQRDPSPWKVRLDVPAFDPSASLMPDSSIKDLSAELTGSGDISHAQLNGKATLNGETVRLEKLHVARRGSDVDLDALVQAANGTLRATGAVMATAEPIAAKLAVQWQDIVVPESLAGQVLHSAGELALEGSAEAYTARGALRVGPPQHLADIDLRLKGSPQRVELERLDVRQAAGQLAATGHVDLQPQVGWDVKANARHFDPGAFAVTWKGDLNFDIASNGKMIETGPDAHVRLTDLNGRLRGRALRGAADLALTRDRVLTGVLDVASGRSRVHVDGKSGASMDARARIDVPDLADWLPNSGGSLDANFVARGRWPDLTIAGNARGNGLRLATAHAESLALDLEISRPLDPSGKVSLDASQLASGSFNFASFRLRGSGDANAHTLSVDASGEPLTAALRVQGGRTRTGSEVGWSGTIEELRFGVKDVARLALQERAKVVYSPRESSLSQACLADGELRACLAGRAAQSGELAASYSLQAVPLALAKAVAPQLPLTLQGTLNGEGDVHRTAEGQISGKATVRSDSGQITRVAQTAKDAPQVLLKYDALRIDAQLDRERGQASVDARLNDAGQLKGTLALSGVGAASTDITGELAAQLPSIAVVELFAPQLANVQGQLRANAKIAGTLDAPRIDGRLDLTDLASDVPTVGLKLRNGHVNVTTRDDDTFAMEGGISSGKGALQWTGVATRTGNARIEVDGKQFLAADIPGAQVVVQPKLTFQRTAERMTLDGEVHIPSASVDLQKLPRTQRSQAASSDVVVIDAVTQEEVQQEKIPLYANVNVTLGEEVALVGFGLNAKVAGQLGVRESPGAATTGAGEVRVEGTYKAYGQDLKIREGRLLFAGTPLDDPRLKIVAVREVEDVVAGLRVEGSARSPQLTVFSEPAMGQSNALAYLVTGKPLSEVGSGDGDALQTAARSLGAAAGGLLAKSIGKRVGVDELAIKDSEAIGGAALTVGQYLSPRLYLSYGVGIFEPGEVVTLRYKLSKALALEALNGPRDSRAGVEYRIER